MRFTACLLLVNVWIGLLIYACANPDAKRLYEDVMVKRDYNKLIRPVNHHSDTLMVYLGLKLAQLIDIDEKNQIMVTNVWVKKAWSEPRLRWNPKDYGEISQLRIPSADLWLPDVVMFNNADGNYEVNKETKALLYSNGMVVWEPPAIFKSSCQIDVEFFPFDKQRCVMKFGSWTYDGLQVDLRHISQTNGTPLVVEYGIDLEGFHESTEWDVLHVPAKRNQKVYPCCPEPYPDITFTIVLRRKTLFYLVNLIFPCVAISFLTLFVFYLPSDSGEKTTLCISILLAVTFFFLVLAESIPPTSLVVPMIGKYLMFTMILVFLSIVITVLEMNVNVRTPATHRMQQWIRRVFLEVLPKLLLIKRPMASRYDLPRKAGKPKQRAVAGVRDAYKTTREGDSECRSWLHFSGRRNWRNLSQDMAPQAGRAAGEADAVDAGEERDATLRRRMARDLESLLDEDRRSEPPGQVDATAEPTWKLRPDFVDDPANHPSVRRDIREALNGVQFIAKHMGNEAEEKKKIDDWKFITRVMDRLFLWVFSIICFLGTAGMFLQAPSLYDSEMPIDVKNMTFKTIMQSFIDHH